MMQLNSLLKPRSVALFGWPGEELAKIITDTVTSSSFSDIFLVSSGPYLSEAGRPYYRANELPLTPDLALICTNALAAPEAMAEACAIGIKTAVVISPDPEGSNPDTLLKR